MDSPLVEDITGNDRVFFPGDILQKMIEYLDCEDVQILSTVDTTFRAWFARKGDPIWKYFLMKDFPLRFNSLGVENFLDKFSLRALYIRLLKPAQMFDFRKSDISEGTEKMITTVNMSIEMLSDLIKDDVKFKIWLRDGPGLLRGDFIRFDWYDINININVLIWDGENFTNLHRIREGRRSQPKEFAYPEFPLEHFYVLPSLTAWITDPEIMINLINNSNTDWDSCEISIRERNKIHIIRHDDIDVDYVRVDLLEKNKVFQILPVQRVIASNEDFENVTITKVKRHRAYLRTYNM